MDRMPKMCGGMVFVMLLGRNAHPHSVRGTMEKLYGYDRTQITKWTNYMLEYVFDQWAFLLDLNEERLSNKMNEYCALLGTKANPEDPSACKSYLCIDGVNVRVCYPTRYQERYYNGAYKYHGIKFQGMVSPVGIVESCYGPLPSVRNDAAMWDIARDFSAMTRINERVGRVCTVLGDPAYRGRRMRAFIVTSHDRNRPLTPEELTHNGNLARARVCIEWTFGRIFSLWRRLSFVPRMQVGVSPLGKLYLVCVILSNVHTCLNGGNQTAYYFGGEPPTLEEYLSAPRPARRRSRAHEFYNTARQVLDDNYSMY